MASGGAYIKSRTRSTFYTSLFIISLVMFVLALFAGVTVFSYVELEKAQEDIVMMVTLPDNVDDGQIDAFEGFLMEQPYVKDIEYISKEDAGELFMEDLGEDFLNIMDGVNPLPASFDIRLHAAYIQSDSLDQINEMILGQEFIKIEDITYPMEEIKTLRERTWERTKMAIGIGLLVALIGFFIVNGTVRLAVYSKRLVIRSMQLIGATNGFIRRPFIKLGILQGLLGAIVACIFLVALVFLIPRLEVGIYSQSEAIKELPFRIEFVTLLGGIIIFGTILGWLSSSWAVNRFLNKNLDQLI